MGKRYQNLSQKEVRPSFWDFISWRIGRYKDPIFRLPPPKDFIYPAACPLFDGAIEELPPERREILRSGSGRQVPCRNQSDSSLDSTLLDRDCVELPVHSAVWMGHSTFLITIDSLSILTDPIWDLHCAPLPLPAFKRLHEPPISLSDLPPIDLVLISHNHYDHLDVKTVRHLHAFHPQIEWIVPLGLSKWFKRRGIERVRELGWWETTEVMRGKLTAVPAQHFSGRSLWDQNQTHWNGYVFEENLQKKRFYFTGDTGYNPSDFKAIGSSFPHMDLSLIPIGTYVPQKFMQPVHCNPWEAVEIHKDVKSRLSLGMHWGTFRLSEEPLHRPPYDLYLAMKTSKLPFETFLPIEPGVQINW